MGPSPLQFHAATHGLSPPPLPLQALDCGAAACPLCLDVPEDSLVSSCGHVLCRQVGGQGGGGSWSAAAGMCCADRWAVRGGSWSAAAGRQVGCGGGGGIEGLGFRGHPTTRV